MDVLIELLIRAIAALFRDRDQPRRSPPPPPPPPGGMPQGPMTNRPVPPSLEELRRMAAARPRPAQPPGGPQQPRRQPTGLPPQRVPIPQRPGAAPAQRVNVPQQRRKIAAPPARRGAPPPPLPAAAPPAPEPAPEPQPTSPTTVVRPAGAPANQLKPSISGAEIRRLINSRPNALRTMWVLAEVLQPPVSLRGEA